jgi:hypothetical protein
MISDGCKSSLSFMSIEIIYCWIHSTYATLLSLPTDIQSDGIPLILGGGGKTETICL